MFTERTTLLVGNGPNRLSESAVSWKDVIGRLSNQVRPKINMTGKPLTLIFEEIALKSQRRDQSYVGTMKKQLATEMQDLVPNSVHRRIMGLKPANILTTNYDYSLERAYNKDLVRQDRPVPIVNELKFSLFRARKVGSTVVWHIHGEIDNPRSIMLGFDHYVSYLSRLETYMRYPGLDGNISPFLRKIKHFEKSNHPFSWVDVFLRDNVHILGLALSFEEIHLWWLLTLKERFRQNCIAQKRQISVGRTVFYDLQKIGDMSNYSARQSLLEALGVEVVPVLFEEDWEYIKAYHSAIKLICIDSRRRPTKSDTVAD